MQATLVRFLGWEDLLDKDRLPTPVFLVFFSSSAGKESTCNAGDLGSISGSGKSPGEGKGYLPQYSGLENSMNCIVHGGLKESDTAERLSLHFHLKPRPFEFGNWFSVPRTASHCFLQQLERQNWNIKTLVGRTSVHTYVCLQIYMVLWKCWRRTIHMVI